jgi:hypothetical protein
MTVGQETDHPVDRGVSPSHGTALPRGSGAAIAPQSADGKGGCGCSGGSKLGGGDAVNYSYVYALGRIEPRFATPGVEKEFAQATGRAKTAGLSDRQALHAVLSRRENRYLSRQLCWVFSVGGVETYILQPRDPGDFQLLVESVRPSPRPTDIDVVIGVRGPIAPPEACNGLMVPMLAFDQMYSFDVDALVGAIRPPEGHDAGKFKPLAEELFWRVMQLSDNAGATDEHRALNYLIVRYDATYAKAAECYGRNCSLTAVDVRPSPLNGTRKLVDVIFSFTHRETDFTEKFSVRVDVTEEFPFLAAKLAPYFDR